MIVNEQIKAAEVSLTGVDGEDLGIVATKVALQMAKEQGVDLVCLSLATSPPPCQLVNRTNHKEQLNREKAKQRKAEKGMKVKELRLSAFIEDHDYETKKRQAEKILAAGDAVQLTVRLEKKRARKRKSLSRGWSKSWRIAENKIKGFK